MGNRQSRTQARPQDKPATDNKEETVCVPLLQPQTALPELSQVPREEKQQARIACASPAKEPARDTSAEVNPTAAAMAFKRHCGDLVTAIVEPLPLAMELYAKEIIPTEVRDRTFLTSLTTTEKNCILLQAVEARIKVAPADLWILVDIFSGNVVLQTFASRLRTSYCVLSTASPSAAVACSPVIARYADYLKAVYRTSPVAPDHKWPPTPSTQFINLAVVKKERVSRAESDAFTRQTLHGHIGEILKKKEPVSLEDVLKPEGQEDVRCVLVEGAPGVGKSTFAWEFCRRWDAMEALRKYSLVVLLRLREKRVQEATDLVQLFYHDDPSLPQAVVQEVLAGDGRGTLLCLDGFDEMPVRLRKSSLVVRIICGTCLPKATVLVTSRPSASTDLLSVARPLIHKRIEVLGFNWEQVLQYVQSVFAINPQVVSDYCKYISSSPSIRSMLFIPLNSAIVAEIYRINIIAGQLIPHTMTQLYRELSHTLLRRYLIERGELLADHLPNKLEDLPSDLYDQLFSLAKLAFEGVVKQEVIFSGLPEGYNHLGFMTASGELYVGSRGSVSHSFLHLTLQEFLAAFYISRLPASEQKVVFEQYCEKQFSHMDVVWRFVAGLTGFRGIGWELVQSRRGRDEYGDVTPFLARCCYEAQEEVAFESILGEGIVGFDEYGSMTVSDYFTVGYCIAASKCAWRLHLGLSGLGAETVEMLVYGLKSRAEVGGVITMLEWDGNHIKREGIAHFKDMPHKILQQTSELSLHDCEMDHTAMDLLAETIPMMTSLRSLNISLNPAADGGTVKLLHALSSLSSLRSLDMHHTDIGCADIRALSHLIRPSGYLRELWIGDKGMSPECQELMMKTVFSPSSLEDLTILCVDLTSSFNSFAILKDNSNLIKLFFHSNRQEETSSGVRALISALQHNHTLQWVMVPEEWQQYFSSSRPLDSRITFDSFSGSLSTHSASPV